MNLIIGCPIYKRDWILHHWIRCLLNQSYDLSKIGFIFETAPDDEKTIEILELWKRMQTNIPLFEIKVRDDIPHFEHEENARQWTVSRYTNMVSLRNSLLASVREYGPDFYFSLDSDILLENPNTLELLIAHIRSGADAVSPLMFMTPIYDRYPSVMSWHPENPERAFREEFYPIGTYFKADVIMAAKMMSKRVYSEVDYVIHSQGEDVGWSLECKKKGFDLYSASYIYAPHIMSMTGYNTYLQFGDDRLSNYGKQR